MRKQHITRCPFCNKRYNPSEASTIFWKPTRSEIQYCGECISTCGNCDIEYINADNPWCGDITNGSRTPNQIALSFHVVLKEHAKYGEDIFDEESWELETCRECSKGNIATYFETTIAEIIAIKHYHADITDFKQMLIQFINETIHNIVSNHDSSTKVQSYYNSINYSWFYKYRNGCGADWDTWPRQHKVISVEIPNNNNLDLYINEYRLDILRVIPARNGCEIIEQWIYDKLEIL